MLFDRISRMTTASTTSFTAPFSPTTTGKVERFHKTLRKDFFTPNDHRFETPGRGTPEGSRRVGGHLQHDPPAPVGRRPSSGRALRTRLPIPAELKIVEGRRKATSHR